MSICTSTVPLLSTNNHSTTSNHNPSRCSACHNFQPLGASACSHCGSQPTLTMMEATSPLSGRGATATAGNDNIHNNRHNNNNSFASQQNSSGWNQARLETALRNSNSNHGSPSRQQHPHHQSQPQPSQQLLHERQPTTPVAAAAAHVPGDLSPLLPLDWNDTPLPLEWDNNDNDQSNKRSSMVIDLSSDNGIDSDDDDRKMPATKKPRAMDELEAARLQAQEIEERKQQEQNAMYLSNSGRAFKFVETMIQMHQTILQEVSNFHDIKLVGQDDLVFLAERFLLCQQNFVAANKPTHVSLVYHYTSEHQMQSIRQDGLLSHPERQSTNISAPRRAYFGDGVYTSNNPYGFRHFGNTGLLCAVLKGQETRVGQGGTQDPNVNTVIGNKSRSNFHPLTDEIVLKECCQVLPIIRFSALTVDPSGAIVHSGNALLWRFHVELQKILDQFFNCNVPTPVERVTPLLPVNNNNNAQNQAPPIPIPAAAIVAANTNAFPAPPSSSHAAGASSSSTVTDREKEMRRQKERFLMFTRVLMKYLETKDPALHQKVKAIVKDCAERNKRQERGYESITASMRERLKPVVDGAYWKRAESYLAHFLAQKQKAQGGKLGVDPQQQAAEMKRNEAVELQRRQRAAQAAQQQLQRQRAAQAAQQALLQAQQWPLANAVAQIPLQQSLAHLQQAQATTALQNGFFSNQPACTGTASAMNVTAGSQAAAVSPIANPAVRSETVTYTAPASLATADDCCRRVRTLSRSEDCAICFTRLHRKGRVLQLYACGHMYHGDCISTALQHDSKCPTCRVPVSKDPQGRSPSGTMSISHTGAPCGGFADANGSITIRYVFPSGTQLPYHETPGQAYSSTRRVAYLPNNEKGKNLLKRFKYAWSKGLLFGIGHSLTTGRSGQIVWGSVHQKSSLQGGAHGFPDPNYFGNANGELDTLGVPPHEKINN